MKYERDTAVAELVLGVCVCMHARMSMSLWVSVGVCVLASERACVSVYVCKP